MSIRIRNPVFFSFDGIDGVGKSTQAQLFADWLREQGRDVVVCRDPGSTPLGEKLRQIVVNRVVNAFKFTREGSVTVRLVCQSAGIPVMLEVEDTGIGIPTEKLEEIFEPFVQVDSGTSRQFNGTQTAPSLAIAKKLSRNSTLFISSSATRSPLPTPSARSAPAVRLQRAFSSA